MTKSTLVWGSDPEFFAGKKDENGNYYVVPPAFFRVYRDVPYIPDIKHPVFIDMKDKMGIIIMEDGCAFEGTFTPDTDWKSLFERIQVGKQMLSTYILSKFPDDCEPETLTLPTINYEVDRW